MRVNFVFYGHQGWILGDIASQIERHNPDIEFVRSELPVTADVYHVIRPNWAAENGHIIPQPALVSHHGQGVRGGNLLYGSGTMDVFRDAELIAVLNMSDIAEMAQAGVDCDKCRYIPHGVDLDRFTPRLKPERSEPFKVLRVGRRYVQGPDPWYSAENKGGAILKKISEKLGDGYELVLLAGDDKGWQDSHGVTVKNVPYAQYPAVYQDCDAYLITSRSEGGPASLLEAMACGLPVVSTPTGMAKDIVVPGDTGHFYPFNDAATAHTCIEHLRSGNWWGSKMQVEMSRQAAMPFSWASIAHRYRAAYMELAHAAPIHATHTRSWIAGKFAETRCLSRKERDCIYYRHLRDKHGLSGRGLFRDWEYPAVDAAIGNAKDKDILVIGGMNDLLALSLCKRYGNRVTLTDPEGFDRPWRFDDPKHEQPKWPAGPKYIAKTVQNARLRAASFDLAVSISVIEHDPNPGSAIRQIAVLLRPGGRLVMTVDYTPYRTKSVPELKLTAVDRNQLKAWAYNAGLRFVGGCDWDTREGAGRMFAEWPKHLRDRFKGKSVPYLSPLITVLEKPK